MSGSPVLHAQSPTAQEWDAFLADCPEACFFDSSRWLATIPSGFDDIRRVIFHLQGKPAAGISFGIREGNDRILAQSPPAASFGGLAWRERPSLSTALAAAEALVREIHALSHRPVDFRYVQRPQVMDARTLLQVEEFCLLRQGFAPLESRVEYYIELKDYSPCASHRRKIAQAARSLVFAPADIEEFLEFRRRVIAEQGKITTVDDAHMRAGYAAADGSIRVYKAIRDGSTVAMLLEDRVTPTCAIGRNWFHDEGHLDLHPTAFLLDSWLRSLQAAGLHRASLGGTVRMSLPFNPGIAFFKERFRPAAAMRKEFLYSTHPMERT